MKYVLYAILIYVAYRFIFHFLVPVVRTSRKIKKGFREMHTRMEEQRNRQQGNTPNTSANTPRPKPAKEDYLDFEEVK